MIRCVAIFKIAHCHCIHFEINYKHYSLKGKMRVLFIDSDLLYRGRYVCIISDTEYFILICYLKLYFRH